MYPCMGLFIQVFIKPFPIDLNVLEPQKEQEND